MIEDLIKFLIEEPEKIKKLFLILLRIVINSIFASFLYVKFVHEYYLINLLEIQAVTEFFLSGRVVIVLLLYFTSDFILDFIKTSIFLIYNLGESFLKGVIDKKDFRWFVFKLNIIQKDPFTQEIIPGKNFNQLHEIVDELNTDEGNQFLYELKDSLITQVLDVFIKFTFIYYVILYNEINSKLNIIVVVGFIGLTSMYFGASWFIKMIRNVSPGILVELQGIKTKEMIDKYLSDNGFSAELEYSNGEKSEPYIEWNNTKYYIVSRISQVKFDHFLIESYINRYLSVGSGLILFFNQELTKEAIKLYQSNKDRIIVVTYVNENDLKTKIDHLFKEDIENKDI